MFEVLILPLLGSDRMHRKESMIPIVGFGILVLEDWHCMDLGRSGRGVVDLYYLLAAGIA